LNGRGDACVNGVEFHPLLGNFAGIMLFVEMLNDAWAVVTIGRLDCCRQAPVQGWFTSTAGEPASSVSERGKGLFVLFKGNVIVGPLPDVAALAHADSKIERQCQWLTRAFEACRPATSVSFYVRRFPFAQMFLAQ
jgi:hypothetical protein